MKKTILLVVEVLKCLGIGVLVLVALNSMIYSMLYFTMKDSAPPEVTQFGDTQVYLNRFQDYQISGDPVTVLDFESKYSTLKLTDLETGEIILTNELYLDHDSESVYRLRQETVLDNGIYRPSGDGVMTLRGKPNLTTHWNQGNLLQFLLMALKELASEPVGRTIFTVIIGVIGLLAFLIRILNRSYRESIQNQISELEE